MEDRAIETVGDLKLALEGIEDDAPFYLFGQQVGSDKKCVLKIRRWDRAVVLHCIPEK